MSMRQAFQDAGLLREPVQIAQSKHEGRGGHRRPVESSAFKKPEKQKLFDTPMSPWAEGTPDHIDPIKVLRRNRIEILEGGLIAWLNAATILKIPISDSMKSEPRQIRNAVERALQ